MIYMTIYFNYNIILFYYLQNTMRNIQFIDLQGKKKYNREYNGKKCGIYLKSKTTDGTQKSAFKPILYLCV